MNIPDELKKTLLELAKEYEPLEMCGFVVSIEGKLEFIHCENIAPDPQNYFEISPDDFIRAEEKGHILALVHSHPNGEPKLSLADRQMQLLSDLDWWLICDDEVYQFPKVVPLISRTFEHGKMDCYTLFRDFYYLCGFDFPDYLRADEWWWQGENLYLEHLEENGFYQVSLENIQVGDVVLVRIESPVPNHAAIYVGEQRVLHHAPKRLSKRDLYDGYWLKYTHSIWRHKEWLMSNSTAVLNNLAANLG